MLVEPTADDGRMPTISPSTPCGIRSIQAAGPELSVVHDGFVSPRRCRDAFLYHKYSIPTNDSVISMSYARPQRITGANNATTQSGKTSSCLMAASLVVRKLHHRELHWPSNSYFGHIETVAPGIHVVDKLNLLMMATKKCLEEKRGLCPLV